MVIWRHLLLVVQEQASRKYMSATMKNVQATGLENTLPKKNKYGFTTQKSQKSLAEAMWTKIEPKWRRIGAKIEKKNNVLSDEFKIKMASPSFQT